LDVQKQQVWPVLLRGSECLGPVGAFRHDFHVRLVGEEGTDTLARERFIVGDDGTHFHEWFAPPDVSSGLTGRHGI
jgi:hypothetical protein